MFRTALLTLPASSALPGLARAEDVPQISTERLLIVNGNSGRVVYDDGRHDLFCVARKICVGYTFSGRPIYERTMVCR